MKLIGIKSHGVEKGSLRSDSSYLATLGLSKWDPSKINIQVLNIEGLHNYIFRALKKFLHIKGVKIEGIKANSTNSFN